MSQPSTDWKEEVASDEAERFARYATDMRELQAKKSETFGNGRALHRKPQLGVHGRFEVLPDLPEAARHGLFRKPGTYDAWVRLSNGAADRSPDSKPDIRGFAIKVRGVTGPSALGGETQAQDFLLINHSSFAFPTADEFMGIVLAGSRGPLALLGHFVKRYGFFAAFGKVKKLKATFDKPFASFATEPFFSAAPIACGPYAAKIRMRPSRSLGTPAIDSAKVKDFGAEMASRLLKGPLSFDLSLQFFVDAVRTPIEDASVEWTEDVAPFVKVGRLDLAVQDPTSVEGRALAEEIEKSTFDPWCALAEHRPLGDVMRARKVVYFESQKGRGAAT